MRILDNTKQPNLVNRENLVQLYELALKGTGRKGIEDVIALLRDSDFYDAPASTKFHNNFESGLALHCVGVLQCLNDMNVKFNLGIPDDSIVITALLHDVCKINVYIKQEKFYKVDGEQFWTKYITYGFEDKLNLGHGDKSVIMLLKYIELSDLEMMMIRWHMGGYNESDQRAFNNAREYHKGVSALHLADMQASSFLEVTIDHKLISNK